MSEVPLKLEQEAAINPRLKSMSLSLKVGLFIVVILHVLVLFLFRIKTNHPANHELQKPYVTFVSDVSFSQDAELEEYAMLFDSAPLFIPTRWNAAQLVNVDFKNVSLRQFAEFEPTFELFNQLKPEGLLRADEYKIEKPADLLVSRFWSFFGEFGRSTNLPVSFEATNPVAEVSVIGQPENAPVLMKVDMKPPGTFPITDPVSYTIRRTTASPVWGAPVLLETSGNEALDQSIKQWLQQPEILSQLPIGYLMVRVFFW